jgi:alanine dehydrogenase
MKTTLALIREGKVPEDQRVALTPAQCREICERFPHVDILVQSSPTRCYSDQEYTDAGFAPVQDISQAHIMLGIKEVPVAQLITGKTYLFFSHTIKKQPYNQKLMAALLAKKIRMIDYETLTDDHGTRVIAFGRYAGLVGAYNGVRGYGLKHQLFSLKPAHQCFDLEEMLHTASQVTLPPIRIALTGGGRVASGAMETLEKFGVKKVTVQAFLTQTFPYPVFAQLDPGDYNQPLAAQGTFDLQDFFKHPENYRENFTRFLPKTDLLIAAAYWDPKAPVLFTRRDLASDAFQVKVIADVTCDIEGSIPTTLRASTIKDPFYDIEKSSCTEKPAFSGENHLTVMAVDNLPNELPRDASWSFGRQLIDQVLPGLLAETPAPIISRATLCENGQLTGRYLYLQDYAEGKG